MDVDEGASSRSMWKTPAGISALAAAAAVVVAAFGLVVQVAAGGSAGERSAGGVSPTPSPSEEAPETTDPAGTVAPPDPGETGAATVSGPSSSSAPPAGGIVASCFGCTADELAERRRHLDTLSARLAAVDDDCRDTTENFTDGDALVRVGCSFEGGYGADYVLWPDQAGFEAFGDRHKALEGALVQEWRLVADGPVTGDTVEFVDDGRAVFVWTYDDFLISAKAQRTDDDQDRLNGWWSSVGALLSESS